jgi:chorismate mutase
VGRAKLGPALQQLLTERAGLGEAAAEDLAQRWFTDPDAKKEVARRLRENQLDESAIEAQAVDDILPTLVQLESNLSALEICLHLALLRLTQYREDLAPRLRRRSDQVIAASTKSIAAWYGQ